MAARFIYGPLIAAYDFKKKVGSRKIVQFVYKLISDLSMNCLTREINSFIRSAAAKASVGLPGATSPKALIAACLKLRIL